MNPHLIKTLFPGASKSLLAANAHDYGDGMPTEKGDKRCQAVGSNPEGKVPTTAPVKADARGAADGAAPRRKGKRRRQMNKTEAAFAAILDARIKAGEIVSYEYEGMTLRWGTLDSIKYTPDFTIFEAIEGDGAVRIVFAETKGGHIWPKDMQKFKQARNEWPLFRFEMWQRKKGEWTQLL